MIHQKMKMRTTTNNYSLNPINVAVVKFILDDVDIYKMIGVSSSTKVNCMNKELIAQVGDVVTIKLWKDKRFVAEKNSEFPEYEFKTIAYYNGEGKESDAQYLCVPLDDSLFSANTRIGAFFPLTVDINYIINDPSIFTTLENIKSYYNKFGGWVYIKDICHVKPAVKNYKNDSCSCQVCKTPHYMAAPNQTDGTFICYSCRENPLRAYY